MHQCSKLGTGGIGEAALQGRECSEIVERALRLGCRCVDTHPGPSPRGNEEAVADGVRAAGVARAELFLVVKIAPTAHGERAAAAALDASLRRLGTDYADLGSGMKLRPSLFRHGLRRPRARDVARPLGRGPRVQRQALGLRWKLDLASTEHLAHSLVKMPQS